MSPLTLLFTHTLADLNVRIDRACLDVYCLLTCTFMLSEFAGKNYYPLYKSLDVACEHWCLCVPAYLPFLTCSHKFVVSVHNHVEWTCRCVMKLEILKVCTTSATYLSVVAGWSVDQCVFWIKQPLASRGIVVSKLLLFHFICSVSSAYRSSSSPWLCLLLCACQC